MFYENEKAVVIAGGISTCGRINGMRNLRDIQHEFRTGSQQGGDC